MHGEDGRALGAHIHFQSSQNSYFVRFKHLTTATAKQLNLLTISLRWKQDILKNIVVCSSAFLLNLHDNICVNLVCMLEKILLCFSPHAAAEEEKGANLGK